MRFLGLLKCPTLTCTAAADLLKRGSETNKTLRPLSRTKRRYSDWSSGCFFEAVSEDGGFICGVGLQASSITEGSRSSIELNFRDMSDIPWHRMG